MQPVLPDATPAPRARPVPLGPRAYRTQVRRRGPWMGLVPPAVLGLLSWWLLGGSSTVRGLASFLFGVMAAPALLVGGVPLSHGTTVYLVCALASAALWFALGAIAAQRATRRPAATWGDWWREYLWLAAGVWAGVLGALLAADVVLGRALL